MQKIHHVFVSSTYSDLIDVRKKVSEAIAKAGYVAEGMEIFPASSQSQMEFITRVIDRCDYYVLIIAGKYGSEDEDGISFTEKEYEYACSKNIPVLSLIHSDPASISVEAQEEETSKREKLENFTSRVKQGALVDFWRASDEAATKALAALSQAVISQPGIGWVRADAVAGEDLLREINDLRKKNSELDEKLTALTNDAPSVIPDIASLNDTFQFTVEHRVAGYNGRRRLAVTLSWLDIFTIIGPDLAAYPGDSSVNSSLASAAYTRRKSYPSSDVYSFRVEKEDFKTIRIQLVALGLVGTRYSNTTSGGKALSWSITELGKRQLMQERTVKKKALPKDPTKLLDETG